MKTKRANIITRIMGYFQRKRIEKQIASRQAMVRQAMAEMRAERPTQYIIENGELVPRY